MDQNLGSQPALETTETPLDQRRIDLDLQAELSFLKHWLRKDGREATVEYRDGQRSAAGGFCLNTLCPRVNGWLRDDVGLLGGAIGVTSWRDRAFFLLDSLPASENDPDDPDGAYIRLRGQVAGFYPEFAYRSGQKSDDANVRNALLKLAEQLFRSGRLAQRFELPKEDWKVLGRPIIPAGPEFFRYLPSDRNLDAGPETGLMENRRSPFTSSEEVDCFELDKSAQILCSPGEILFFLYGWRVLLRILQRQIAGERGRFSVFLDDDQDAMFAIAPRGDRPATFNIFEDLNFEQLADELLLETRPPREVSDFDLKQVRSAALPESLLQSLLQSLGGRAFRDQENEIGDEYIARHVRPESLNLWPEWKALGFVYESDNKWWLSPRFQQFLAYLLGLFDKGGEEGGDDDFNQAIAETKDLLGGVARTDSPLSSINKTMVELEASAKAGWPVPQSPWPKLDYQLQNIFRTFLHALTKRSFKRPEDSQAKPAKVLQALYLFHSRARFPLLPYYLFYSATRKEVTRTFGHLVLPLHKSRSFPYEVPEIGPRNEFLLGLFTVDFAAKEWRDKSQEHRRETRVIAIASGILRLRRVLREICTPLVERGFYDQEFAAEKRLQGETAAAAQAYNKTAHQLRKLTRYIDRHAQPDQLEALRNYFNVTFLSPKNVESLTRFYDDLAINIYGPDFIGGDSIGTFIQASIDYALRILPSLLQMHNAVGAAPTLRPPDITVKVTPNNRAIWSHAHLLEQIEDSAIPYDEQLVERTKTKAFYFCTLVALWLNVFEHSKEGETILAEWDISKEMFTITNAPTSASSETMGSSQNAGTLGTLRYYISNMPDKKWSRSALDKIKFSSAQADGRFITQLPTPKGELFYA